MNEAPEIHVFENSMSEAQTVLGWLYLPIHCVLLPVLLGIYVSVSPEPLPEGQVNLVYYGVSLAVVLLLMLDFLREGYDRFLDDPLTCVIGIAFAMWGIRILDLAVSLLLLPLEGAGENPNNTEVLQMARESPGTVRAIAIFLGPMVEEVLFRGVVFGSIRPKRKHLAYWLTALLFGLAHVWSYALAYGNPWLLFYLLQYVPVSLGLSWVYDRTGSIWSPILLHMLFNGLSLAAAGRG